MVDRKQISDEDLVEALRGEPIRVRLPTKADLEKRASEVEDTTDLQIHANSIIKSVYLAERITEEAF